MGGEGGEGGGGAGVPMGSPTGSEDSGVHVFVGRSLRAVAQACGRRRDTRDLAGSAPSPPPLPPSLPPRPPLPPTPGPPRRTRLSPWGGGGGVARRFPECSTPPLERGPAPGADPLSLPRAHPPISPAPTHAPQAAAPCRALQESGGGVTG